MKTGDHLQDGNGRTFQVGQLLGRGLWGKCYLAREGSDGKEWVIKVPLGDDDLPRDPPRLAEACREIAREQGRLLEESGSEALVDLETRFIADDGSPTLLMPRYPETLERRLADLASFDEILQTLTAAMDAIKKFKEGYHKRRMAEESEWQQEVKKELSRIRNKTKTLDTARMKRES